jgi:hypothetical protein
MRASLFVGDSRLYTDYQYYCAHHDRMALGGSSGKLLYHCYWNGSLTAHHALTLKSLAISQTPPFEAWVWMPAADFEPNRRFVESFADVPNIIFRPFIAEREIQGTVYGRNPDIFIGKTRAATSDLVRLLILLKYGGVYFDLDVLFLKDLRPISGADFLYQWSNIACANSAVFCARAATDSLIALAERSLQLGTFHPRRLLAFHSLENLPGKLIVLPSFMFDPVWIAQDTRIPTNEYCNTFEDFFRRDCRVLLHAFFNSSYAYHWHNQWATPIRPDCVAGYLNEEITTEFARRFLSRPSALRQAS